MNLNLTSCASAPLIVRIWPDGTNAVVADIREGEYDHMSDDYVDVDLYDFDACEKHRAASLPIDEAIENIIGPDPLGEQ